MGQLENELFYWDFAAVVKITLIDYKPQKKMLKQQVWVWGWGPRKQKQVWHELTVGSWQLITLSTLKRTIYPQEPLHCRLPLTTSTYLVSKQNEDVQPKDGDGRGSFLSRRRSQCGKSQWPGQQTNYPPVNSFPLLAPIIAFSSISAGLKGVVTSSVQLSGGQIWVASWMCNLRCVCGAFPSFH